MNTKAVCDDVHSPAVLLPTSLQMFKKKKNQEFNKSSMRRSTRYITESSAGFVIWFTAAQWKCERQELGGGGGSSEVDFENQHYGGPRTHRAVPLLNTVHLAGQPFSQLTAVSHLPSPPASVPSQPACVAVSTLTRCHLTITSLL